MSLQYRLRLGQHYVQCDAYPCDAEYPATGEEYYKSAPDGWVHIETQKLGEEIDQSDYCPAYQCCLSNRPHGN
jgi:hypothetical protein